MSAGTCTADGSSLTFRIRRYYDPTTGQFITVDPSVDQTEAQYAYAAGDPVDSSDPTGLFCVGPICTHSFDPSASLDAWINIARGATNGLTDRIANWIVPGASCTVPQDSLDQFIGGAAGTVLGGEALGALLRSGRYAEFLARIRAVEWGDETGSVNLGARRSLPRTGVPNSIEVLDKGNGVGQIREYGPDGRAVRDFDFGHDHGAGDPHAHDWINGDRQGGRPIRPGE